MLKGGGDFSLQIFIFVLVIRHKCQTILLLIIKIYFHGQILINKIWCRYFSIYVQLYNSIHVQLYNNIHVQLYNSIRVQLYNNIHVNNTTVFMYNYTTVFM